MHYGSSRIHTARQLAFCWAFRVPMNAICPSPRLATQYAITVPTLIQVPSHHPLTCSRPSTSFTSTHSPAHPSHAITEFSAFGGRHCAKPSPAFIDPAYTLLLRLDAFHSPFPSSLPNFGFPQIRRPRCTVKTLHVGLYFVGWGDGVVPCCWRNSVSGGCKAHAGYCEVICINESSGRSLAFIIVSQDPFTVACIHHLSNGPTLPTSCPRIPLHRQGNR